jgi:hypothetical protein
VPEALTTRPETDREGRTATHSAGVNIRQGENKAGEPREEVPDDEDMLLSLPGGIADLQADRRRKDR